MINKNELRFGNLVVLPHQPNKPIYPILEIRELGVIVGKSYETGTAYCEFKVADPIPLTTEWLERMGCVVTNFEGEDAALVDIPGLFMAVTFYLKTHSLKPIPAPKAKPIRFVHEFQNFYLDVTKEELAIKEPV